MVMTNLGWTPMEDSDLDVLIETEDPISREELSPMEAVTPLAKPRSHRRKTTLGSKMRAIGLWTKKALAMAFVLAILGSVGIGAWALAQGSWAVNPVLSGSMRPGFTVGGAVISQRIPVSELAVRDVIIFHNPNKPSEEMVHRIVQMTKGPNGQLLIKTQGDANPVPDPWTLTIRGSVYKVRWSLPLLGYGAVAYQNHRGVVLLVAGFVLILVALSVVIRQRRIAKAPPASDDEVS
ncbi:MAG: signal peptidase I [Acidimicrobiales bacterium]